MTLPSLLQRPLSFHVPSPLEAIVAAVLRLLVWQERGRQRKHLSELDDRMLEDIGLSRADVHNEITKPIWRL